MLVCVEDRTRYSYKSMGAPPSLALTPTVIVPVPGVTEVICGTPGTVRGVEAAAVAALPEPAKLKARSLTA